MKQIKQRLASVLVLVLCLTMLPTVAMASDNTPSGYIGIYTASDLDAVRNNLSGNYILMNDIDLSTWGDWSPIGYSIGADYSPFTGIFDGNGKTIQNMNAVMEGASSYYMGLFGVIDHATVKNTVVTGKISSAGYQSFVAGGVAGYVTNSTIENCASYVDITYQYGFPDSNVSASTQWGDGMCAGGIAGRSANDQTKTVISRCANYGTISGMATDTTLEVGGIIGDIISGSFSDDLGTTIISDCFSAGRLEAKTGYIYVTVGGIAGDAGDRNTDISNCYSADVISYQYGGEEASGKDVGGVVGFIGNYSTNRVTYSYYISGSGATAPIGSAEWMLSEDRDLDIQTVGLKALTKSEMKRQASFSGFDFSNVWTMGSGDYLYPVLRGMNGANTVESDDPDISAVQLPAPVISLSRTTILPDSKSQDGTTEISWNAVDGAVSYVVSWFECSGEYKIYTARTTELSYTLNDVAENTYLVKVIAVDQNQIGGEMSNLVKLTVQDGNYASGASVPVLLSESDSVRKGTIRYVNQLAGSELYYKSYWTGQQVYPSGDKCSTCCLSMILSYLGINALPSDIRDADNTNFYYQMTPYNNFFVQHGILKSENQVSVENYKTSYADLERMLDNFETDENYSPVMLQMYYGKNVSHFVLVIADLGEGWYQTVDPGNSNAIVKRYINTSDMTTEYRGNVCNVRFTQYSL